MPIIRAENLTKIFPTPGDGGQKIAVNNVNLSVEPQEIFGLLGPNGAGKTTTVKMLAGETLPTSGAVFYNDESCAATDIKEKIGVVPQHINFDRDLTVGENLELAARLYRLPAAERRRRIAELLSFMDFDEKIAGMPVTALSGGMKRRLLIARALIHRPRIVFMDEPTVALDPAVRRRIWGLIRQMAANGTTIILTTHYIEEAQQLCRRVAFLRRGELVATDTPQEFCRRLGKFAVEWDEAGERRCRFFAEHTAAAAFAASLNGAHALRPTNLEDAFMRFTGEDHDLFS